MRPAIIFIFVMAIAFSIINQSKAFSKKPLFNGSIFGKRGSIIEYDSKVLSAICEITTETCQAWFLALENK
ncbi:hypothetical protein NE865_12214 [Phthorimaea operculella]|nr:hypothetical protein NE865_12214 [Phthorimaea operculella]